MQRWLEWDSTAAAIDKSISCEHRHFKWYGVLTIRELRPFDDIVFREEPNGDTANHKDYRDCEKNHARSEEIIGRIDEIRNLAWRCLHSRSHWWGKFVLRRHGIKLGYTRPKIVIQQGRKTRMDDYIIDGLKAPGCWRNCQLKSSARICSRNGLYRVVEAEERNIRVDQIIRFDDMCCYTVVDSHLRNFAHPK